MHDTSNNAARGASRRGLGAYADRRILQVLVMYFNQGLPLYLTYSTLSAWLASVGIRRAAIGALALATTPYAFKFLWSPLIDRLPPPIPLGRRRGWGVTIQLLLMAAIVLMGATDPKAHLLRLAVFAFLVAFLSASQDIVIDAWRVEILPLELQGPGAGILQVGYRLGILLSGAGALFIADRHGWFVSYTAMAASLVAGMLVFLFSGEPEQADEAARRVAAGQHSFRGWLSTAVVGPFADFMKRPMWLVVLIFVFGYKLGEAMAAVMASPLYISLGFTLSEIAAISKILGVVALMVGALIGSAVTLRFGILRSLMLCGILQSAGNLFYVLQAVGGHKTAYLALCVTSENLTSAMAGTALIAYLSSLCSPAFTATQYALLSSIASLGRTLIASTTGVLAERLGWVGFFLVTTVITIPALLLLLWISRRSVGDRHPEQIAPEPASTTS